MCSKSRCSPARWSNFGILCGPQGLLEPPTTLPGRIELRGREPPFGRQPQGAGWTHKFYAVIPHVMDLCLVQPLRAGGGRGPGPREEGAPTLPPSEEALVRRARSART